MRIWLRLTHLFGLPEGQEPENLMQAALGPVLRAAWQDVVEAPLPEPIARLLQELCRRDWPMRALERPRSLAPTRRLRADGRPRRVRRVPALPRTGTGGAYRGNAGERPRPE
jgi:hypothetical protein